jgi:hypothetical protein
MKNLFFLLAASLFVFSACSDDDDDSTKAKLEIKKEKVLSDSIAISWNLIEDASFYTVRIEPDDEFQSTSIPDNKTTTFVFKDLKADTKYSIKVEAIAAIPGKTAEENIIEEGKTSITTEALPEEFLGAWKYTNLEKAFSFKKDGTGEYTEGNSKYNIRWRINNEEIIIRYYDEDNECSNTEEYEYSFNEGKNVLTLKYGTNEFNFSLQEK